MHPTQHSFVLSNSVVANKLSCDYYRVLVSHAGSQTRPLVNSAVEVAYHASLQINSCNFYNLDSASAGRFNYWNQPMSRYDHVLVVVGFGFCD